MQFSPEIHLKNKLVVDILPSLSVSPGHGCCPQPDQASTTTTSATTTTAAAAAPTTVGVGGHGGRQGEGHAGSHDCGHENGSDCGHDCGHHETHP